MRRNKHAGFTLVELLVVIAIIGILAALLVTAVSLVRGRAQRIHCVSNVRQQGLGMQAFVMDYHHYPLGYNPNYYEGAYPEYGVGWMTAVAGALDVKTRDTKNPPPGIANGWAGVFRCPAAINWSVPIPGGRMSHADYG